MYIVDQQTNNQETNVEKYLMSWEQCIYVVAYPSTLLLVKQIQKKGKKWLCIAIFVFVIYFSKIFDFTYDKRADSVHL